MAKGKLFGSEIFDPRFITSQILALQAFFYFVQITLFALLNNIFGLQNHLDQIFTSKSLDLQDSYSLVYILSNILSMPFTIFSVVFIIERTSKCLDFISTIYLFHLAFVYFYFGIPLNMFWWGINGGIMFLTVLISEYICMKIEQQEIYLNFASKKVEIP